MGQVHAYSSINISDDSDLGSLSSFLSSNQPTSVVFNPDTNQYTPDWSVTPGLTITPVISYNGTSLPLNTQGLSISFSRKDGSGNATALTTGETVTGGVLTVSQNKLRTSTSGILTYICDVYYTDPGSGTTIHNQNMMSYSLLSNASTVKTANITGENAFLYDASRQIVGQNVITLKADVTNVAISKWQYLNSQGVYVDFPTTHNPDISTTSLDVYASEASIWVNSRTATIKLVTTDENVYDVHQILKIYDGASGSSTVSIVLSNQSHYVPCDSSGNVLSWNGAASQVYVYEGGADVTSQWTITTTLGSGLTGSFTNHVFTPSGLTDETSYVDFTCTQSGYSNLTARYTITKARTGADGQSAVIYEIEPSSYVINLNELNEFSPRNIVFSAYTKTGNSNRLGYNGRFIIAESTDGTTYTDTYTSSTNETSKTYVPSSTSVSMIRARLYASGGTSTLLDEQTTVVTRDGISGENGSSGLTLNLVNRQDVIPCNDGGYTSLSYNITIPYFAYLGISRIPVTAFISSELPRGLSLLSNTSGTIHDDGEIVLHVDRNEDLGSPDTLNGTINIALVCDYTDLNFQYVDENGNVVVNEDGTILTGQHVLYCSYAWTKNLQGSDANILQIYSEDGGVIRNSEGNTTLKIRYMSGGTQVVPTAIKWYKFQSGSYAQISGQTSNQLVVTAAMVDDLAFFKATATYLGVTCEAYYTVDDLQDPFTAVTMSTVREFKNGYGCGAVYTRLYRGNTEVDVLKSTTFSTQAPSPASTGDMYYHLNQSEKTVTLKRYNGSSWVSVSEGYQYTYKYYKINKDGQTINPSSPIIARCVYVDPTVVGDIMQFVCEVE